MIKQNTIDELRGKMDITEVIGNFITVKKDKGCCPFHNENTPSFTIKRAWQTFKCFGCGASGDAIAFVMKHEKKTFLEAVEWLCAFYHIAVEIDQVAQQEAQERKDERQEMIALLQFAQKKFEDLLHTLPADASAMEYLHSRGYDDERIRSWSLGYAPDDWKFLTTPVINQGKHAPGVASGLLYSNGGKNWDFFRNRIIIPIHDHNGVLVGFGGRLVPSDDAETKKQPKYLNPPESAVYSKSKVWYGLWQAQKAVRDEGFVYVVEGYLDVQAMHDSDVVNTIASCGTEIDEQQVKLLKRYTDHVCMCYDGDDAGTKKMMKQIDLFLRHAFKVTCVELPGKMDPDEYIRAVKSGELLVENVE